MPLDPEQVLELRNVVDAAQERVAKSQKEILTLIFAGAGVVFAAIMGIFAWGVSSVIDKAVTAANDSAKTEARAYLASAPVVQDFRNRLAQAEAAVTDATKAAARASIAAEQTATTISDLKQQLQDGSKILSAIKDVNSIAASLSANAEFRDSVVKVYRSQISTSPRLVAVDVSFDSKTKCVDPVPAVPTLNVAQCKFAISSPELASPGVEILGAYIGNLTDGNGTETTFFSVESITPTEGSILIMHADWKSRWLPQIDPVWRWRGKLVIAYRVRSDAP